MSDDPVWPDRPETEPEADVADGESPDGARSTGDEPAEANREQDPPA